MRVRGVRLLSLLLNLNRLLLGVILMSSYLTVAAENLDVETVAASGIYYFGPSMSELDACSKAQDRMEEAAVETKSLTARNKYQSVDCSSELQRSNGIACDVASGSLSYWKDEFEIIDRLITKTEVDYPKKSETYSCTVSGNVTLKNFESGQDSEWLTGLKVTALDSPNGVDRFTLTISSSHKGFHYVFHESGDGSLKLVFPNKFDRSNFFRGDENIPREKTGARKYQMQVQNTGSGPIGEIFYMLSTRQPLSAIEAGEFTSLTALQKGDILDDLPLASWVQQRGKMSR